MGSREEGGIYKSIARERDREESTKVALLPYYEPAPSAANKTPNDPALSHGVLRMRYVCANQVCRYIARGCSQSVL